MKLEYNYVLCTALLSWLAAQIIKTIINLIKTKKFNPERLVGAGGMPSSHSSLVCSATVGVCRQCGLGSVQFAMMFIFAMVVMYDAMGVRRAAGLHAHEINRMNKIFAVKGISSTDVDSDASDSKRRKKKKTELKEYLGHTPFEVLGGALLGILMSLIMPMSI